MSILTVGGDSLLPHKKLQQNSKNLVESIGRLTSGKRIITAKNDQANFAIANRINGDIRESNRRAIDLNDSISMAQIANSGINQIVNNIQKMKEITIKAANASYTSQDRINMQSEIDGLVLEIKRIANSVQYNGINLLDGTKRTSEIDTGNSTIDLNLLSFSNTPVEVSVANTLVELDLKEAGDKLMVRDNISDLDWLKMSETDGESYNNVVSGYGDYTTTHQFSTVSLSQIETLVTNVGGDNPPPMWSSQNYQPAVDILSKFGSTQGSGSVSGISYNSAVRGMTSSLQSGTPIIKKVYYNDDSEVGGFLGYQNGWSGLASRDTEDSKTGIWLNRDSSLWEDPALILSDVFDISVLTQDSANSALSVIDTGLDSAVGVQNTIGSVTNRLESVITNYETNATVMKGVYSRIVDTNIPEETTKLVFQQIIQQANVSLTAQSNMNSKIVHDILFKNI